MKPYSQDLRDRVIAAVEAGQHSYPEIATTFAVSESTLDKILLAKSPSRIFSRPFLAANLSSKI